jgi:hypothetical protein
MGWGGSTRTKARARATAGVVQGSTRMGVAAAGPQTRAYQIVHGGHLEELVGDGPRGRRRIALLDVREQEAECLAHVRYAIRIPLHPARHGLRWLQR